MREKILIVEDEEEIAMLEQDYLETTDFRQGSRVMVSRRWNWH